MLHSTKKNKDSHKKEKDSKLKTLKNKKASNVSKNESNDELSIEFHIKQSLDYTIKNDSDYNKYYKETQFITMVKQNPSILILNKLYHETNKKSLIVELLKKSNSEVTNSICYCLDLNIEKKSFILNLLIERGFNTIFDILLENTESFYLIGFTSYLCSKKVINDSDSFLTKLSNNEIYKFLRDTKIIEKLQISGIYTRIKKYQLE